MLDRKWKSDRWFGLDLVWTLLPLFRNTPHMHTCTHTHTQMTAADDVNGRQRSKSAILRRKRCFRSSRSSVLMHPRNRSSHTHTHIRCWPTRLRFHETLSVAGMNVSASAIFLYSDQHVSFFFSRVHRQGCHSWCSFDFSIFL